MSDQNLTRQLVVSFGLKVSIFDIYLNYSYSGYRHYSQVLREQELGLSLFVYADNIRVAPVNGLWRGQFKSQTYCETEVKMPDLKTPCYLV